MMQHLLELEAGSLSGEAAFAGEGAQSGLERKQLNEESRAIFRKQFRKTQLCRFYKGSGCQLGPQCQFAHGREELQKAPDLRRTSICTRWVQGQCPESAETCTFAHGANYLRRTVGFSKKISETQAYPEEHTYAADFEQVATGHGLNDMFELKMMRQLESTMQLQKMIQDQQQQIEILKSQLIIQEQVQLKQMEPMGPPLHPVPMLSAYKGPYLQPPLQATASATTMSCDLRLSL